MSAERLAPHEFPCCYVRRVVWWRATTEGMQSNDHHWQCIRGRFGSRGNRISSRRINRSTTTRKRRAVTICDARPVISEHHANKVVSIACRLTNHLFCKKKLQIAELIDRCCCGMDLKSYVLVKQEWSHTIIRLDENRQRYTFCLLEMVAFARTLFRKIRQKIRRA